MVAKAGLIAFTCNVLSFQNGKNAIEVLFQLDKIKLGLPLGKSSWAEPAKEITSKTWKQVLQFAASYFHNILNGPMFEDKYLKVNMSLFATGMCQSNSIIHVHPPQL